jgi:hypothetical protein
MGSLFSRVKSLLGSGVRQRVTRAGWLYTATVLLVGLMAVASANNLLFLILAVMFSAFLISGFVSRLSLAGLELDLALPEHLSAGQKLSGRIFVRNHKGWVPSFSIHLAGSPPSAVSSSVYFPVIPGGATLEETVEVSFGRRGLYRENSFLFSTRFPFGFTERRAHVTLRRDVLVYPCMAVQPGFDELVTGLSGEMQAHYRGRGGEFYRIRPYEPFESARHVDWKATAHTGELQVREFAREQEHLLEVFLDLDVPESLHDWFERAVECCAFLSWWVAERASRLRFHTQEFDCFLPEETDVYGILKYLALVEPLQSRRTPPPDDDTSFQLVLTADPQRMMDAGWQGARFLSPQSDPIAVSARPETPSRDASRDRAGTSSASRIRDASANARRP